MLNSVKNFLSNCVTNFQKLRDLTSAKGPRGAVQVQGLNIQSVPQSEKKGLFSNSTTQWIITPMNNRAVDGNPQQPPIILNNVSPFEASKLLQHPKVLETTCACLSTINPSELKQEDIGAMKALRAIIVDDFEVPQSLKEAVKEKVIDVCKVLNNRAIQCQYGVKGITDKLQGKGAYITEYADQISSLEARLKKDETRSKALQESRKGIVESFTQSQGAINPDLTKKLRAYGEKMIEPLVTQKGTYPLSTQKSLQTKLQALGEKAAQVLQEELQNYEGDRSSLDACLQSYEKKMRSFANNLLKFGQSASNIQQESEGKFMYCDVPIDDKDIIERQGITESNALLVCNTRLQEPLTEKPIESVNKELRQLRQQLGNCSTSEELQAIQSRYKEVNTEINNRLKAFQKFAKDGPIVNAFGTFSNDEVFNARARPGMQQVGKLKDMFKTISNEQWKYSAALAKAQERLDANKAAPQPQDSATSTIATQ